MSTKSGIYSSGNFYLYGECFDEDRAYIAVQGIENSEIALEGKYLNVTVAIPNEVMDELCIAWLKERKLHGSLGGLMGK